MIGSDMKRFAIYLCLCLPLLTGCEQKTPRQLRAAHLESGRGDVVIAVAWPLRSVKGTLRDGVDLALEEVNQAGGVLGGRKVRLLFKDDESSLTKGRLVAQEIANDPDVAAVMGHLNSFIAAPTSLIYERAGIVMITPGASGQKITDEGRQLVFRSLPGNRDQGRQIGDYAAQRGYRNVAVYYIKNDYGIDLANYFEQRANELGIAIADRRSYNMGGDNYATTLSDWASFLKFDAIFLAGSLPESAQIIREARAAGIAVPIFGAVGLDSPELIRLGGSSVEGTVVFSLFNANDPRPEAQLFRRKFLAKFKREPDSSAGQGYDTLKLLVHAIQKAGSPVPDKIAAALRDTQNWRGVTGNHTFSQTGDTVAKPMAKVAVSGGKFVYLNSDLEAAPNAGNEGAAAQR